ncbi:MAG: PIG-L deacetylase family protein [Actinomycetota bacterium]|nr:PIG-L deacetylase family protein [Actinomycetota bacterium]
MPPGLYDQITDPPPPLPIPERIMAIGAHPDDAEFGAGATIFNWTSNGTVATIVVATDGSKGSWDPTIDRSVLVEERRHEQQGAATILGVASVEWLNQVDGELQHTPDLREEISRLIRTHRPDVVLTHDPWQRYQLHPDHRTTGLLAVDAIVAAREPLFYPEQKLQPHRPSTILLWSADEPDHAEPVNDRSFDAKVAALLCHISQSETTLGDAAQSGDARDRFIERLDSWLRSAAVRFGNGRAETFKRLSP